MTARQHATAVAIGKSTAITGIPEIISGMNTKPWANPRQTGDVRTIMAVSPVQTGAILISVHITQVAAA